MSFNAAQDPREIAQTLSRHKFQAHYFSVSHNTTKLKTGTMCKSTTPISNAKQNQYKIITAADELHYRRKMIKLM